MQSCRSACSQCRHRLTAPIILFTCMATDLKHWLAAWCRVDSTQSSGYIAGVTGVSNVTQQWQCQPSQPQCTLQVRSGCLLHQARCVLPWLSLSSCFHSPA